MKIIIRLNHIILLLREQILSCVWNNIMEEVQKEKMLERRTPSSRSKPHLSLHESNQELFGKSLNTVSNELHDSGINDANTDAITIRGSIFQEMETMGLWPKSWTFLLFHLFRFCVREILDLPSVLAYNFVSYLHWWSSMVLLEMNTLTSQETADVTWILNAPKMGTLPDIFV